MKLTLKSYGECGILAQDLSEAARAGLCRALRQQLPDGCLEYVEGDNTLLFLFKQPTPPQELASWLKRIGAKQVARPNGRIVEVPVIYDGPDLESVAKQAGLSVEEVVARHSSTTYTVRMTGFTPGFPYLDGLDKRLHLTRRNVPRQRVVAGSVAIGGSHAGIYSVASPGGWHILGHTDLLLFDLSMAFGDALEPESIFRFAPGDRLRFQPLV